MLPKLTDSAKRLELRQDACMKYLVGMKGMAASLAKQLLAPSERTARPPSSGSGDWQWPVEDLDGTFHLVPHNHDKAPTGMCANLPKCVRFCTILRDFARFLCKH